jgi:RNA polymerase sigma-70 factor, ECF subfamily
MISAFRRSASYRGDSAVTTWLHRIVVNACLDRIRRDKVRAHESLPEDVDREGQLAIDESASAALESQEVRADVTRALAQLNADQRAAIVLVDAQGYSIEEAAVMLGCAEGTIKSRCSRGRAKLAVLLAHRRTS